MQEQVNQTDAAKRDLAKGGDPSTTKKESKRAARAGRRERLDAFWNAVRPRAEAVADAHGLPRNVVDDIFALAEGEDAKGVTRTNRTRAMLAFAERYRQSLDWIFMGDVRAYLRAGIPMETKGAARAM